jgi:hypothetical protein
LLVASLFLVCAAKKTPRADWLGGGVSAFFNPITRNNLSAVPISRDAGKDTSSHPVCLPCSLYGANGRCQSNVPGISNMVGGLPFGGRTTARAQTKYALEQDPNKKRDILEQILALIRIGWEQLFSALSNEENPHQLLLLVAGSRSLAASPRDLRRTIPLTGFFPLAPSQRHRQGKPASMKQRGRRTGDLFRGVKTEPVRPSTDALPLSCLLSATARRNPEHIARRREGTKVMNYGA